MKSRLSWPQPAPVLDALSDANGFTEPSLYRTIQTGDVDGNGTAEVIARTQTGMTVWTVRAGSGCSCPRGLRR